MSNEETHEYQELFVRQLEKYRDIKGVSQREMSLQLGQTAGYISKLVNPKGNNLPRMLNFFYICDFLGIHPKDFFNDEAEHPELVHAIVNDLIKLSEEQLTHISALVHDLAGAG